MLVLSRKKNESIIISEKIILTLLDAEYDTETAIFKVETPTVCKEICKQMDESFLINDKIKIKIIEVSNCRVKLGIEAPKEITVYREEIYNKINKTPMQFTT